MDVEYQMIFYFLFSSIDNLKKGNNKSGIKQ